MAKAKKRKPSTKTKATRPKKSAIKPRSRERKKAKRRVVPAKPSKKPRIARKPVAVSAKKPKRGAHKVSAKPSKTSPKPRSKKKATPRKPPARKKSQTPAAIRARKRRAAKRGQREQLRAEATKLAPAQGGDERRLAWGWLEMIRERIHNDAFGVTLTITELGGGHATLEGAAAQKARETPWMIVGRFDPHVDLDYSMLAHGLQVVADDLLIEAAVHPQRLSQARVEFHDPNDKRREGDTVLSKIGPWEFILTDLAYELVGASWEDPADGSLAARYAQTLVPKFYIFFSREIIRHKSVGPWTVPIQKR